MRFGRFRHGTHPHETTPQPGRAGSHHPRAAQSGDQLPEPATARVRNAKCIRALGPDAALKEHAYTESGDPDKWKRDSGRGPILNPVAIAQAMGTDRRTVHTNLSEARIFLRSVFNPDGKLFLSH